MTNSSKHANSQSVSAQMRKGNTQAAARIKALLKDHAPKANHHFCPPLISQADSDKTRMIFKALT